MRCSMRLCSTHVTAMDGCGCEVLPSLTRTIKPKKVSEGVSFDSDNFSSHDSFLDVDSQRKLSKSLPATSDAGNVNAIEDDLGQEVILDPKEKAATSSRKELEDMRQFFLHEMKSSGSFEDVDELQQYFLRAIEKQDAVESQNQQETQKRNKVSVKKTQPTKQDPNVNRWSRTSDMQTVSKDVSSTKSGVNSSKSMVVLRTRKVPLSRPASTSAKVESARRDPVFQSKQVGSIATISARKKRSGSKSVSATAITNGSGFPKESRSQRIARIRTKKGGSYVKKEQSSLKTSDLRHRARSNTKKTKASENIKRGPSNSQVSQKIPGPAVPVRRTRSQPVQANVAPKNTPHKGGSGVEHRQSLAKTADLRRRARSNAKKTTATGSSKSQASTEINVSSTQNLHNDSPQEPPKEIVRVIRIRTIEPSLYQIKPNSTDVTEPSSTDETEPGSDDSVDASSVHDYNEPVTEIKNTIMLQFTPAIESPPNSADSVSKHSSQNDVETVASVRSKKTSVSKHSTQDDVETESVKSKKTMIHKLVRAAEKKIAGLVREPRTEETTKDNDVEEEESTEESSYCSFSESDASDVSVESAHKKQVRSHFLKKLIRRRVFKDDSDCSHCSNDDGDFDDANLMDLFFSDIEAMFFVDLFNDFYDAVQGKRDE